MPLSDNPTQGRFRVLIAGGGVAALEALLALRECAGEAVAPVMFAPDSRFRHRPLSVTEPFALAAARQIDLLEVALEHGATFFEDALASVDPEGRVARTASGRELTYDALLIATGTRRAVAVPGALTFGDTADGDAYRRVIDEVEDGAIRRLALAVPERATWPLAIYELALLTAERARETDREDVRIRLVTPEPYPLAVFGRRASAAVRALLDRAGIELVLGATPRRFEGGRLELARGEPIECDRAVALPRPEVAEIPGVPLVDGFVPVDRFGAVLGLEAVYAAGDVTWFPLKQGGLAAQQADCAARAIAARAGLDVAPTEFHPILRGALLTAWGPRYLRADAERPEARSECARSVLWWPPGKLAGRLLAPYLAAKAGYPVRADRPLTDLEPPVGDDPGAIDPGRREVVDLSLGFADERANRGDFRGALRWLEVAEDLETYLPEGYELKRAAWQVAAQPR